MSQVDHSDVHDVMDARLEKSKETAEAAKDKAKELADKIGTTVAAAVDEAKQAVVDPERRHAAQQAVEEEVRRNPWRALAAAFLIGMRIGRTRSGRR